MTVRSLKTACLDTQCMAVTIDGMEFRRTARLQEHVAEMHCQGTAGRQDLGSW